MAWTVQLLEGSEPAINLFYLADDNWSLLEKGLVPNDPERFETWGGRLEDQLVRQEDGKRIIPLRLYGEWSTPDELIDGVNALEKRLRHAARYRKDDWGDEIKLRVQPHSAAFPVDFPVLSGQIDKTNLLELCNAPMDAGGDREVTRQNSVGVNLVCEPYWESTTIYALENYVYGAGFWRGAAPGDSWTEVNNPDIATAMSTTIYEVMGQSLQMIISPDGVNDTGVQSDAITVVAATNYYLEARLYSGAANDIFTVRAYNLSVPGVIAGSTITFPAAAAGWVKAGVAFATPAGCVSLRVECLRLAANSTAGNKTYYLDAIYLSTGTTAPVGWCSGRNLQNHMDDGADHLNVLCVTEIPGEVEAEIKATVDLDDATKYIRVAKRTRDDPHGYIWELNAVDAVVSAGAPAYCIDSVLAADGTAPGGQRVAVTFATDKTMVRRCYWDITADLTSYYGKFAVAVIAKMSGATDDCKMQIQGIDENNTQGNITSIIVGNTWWTLHDGWEVLGFRIGTSGGVLGAGNNWRISLYASTNAPGAPTNQLYIACAFLIPLDEPYMVGGSLSFGAGIADMIIQDMDGDTGLFAYIVGTDTYLPNLAVVGSYPFLTPEVENYLYFITTEATEEYDLAHLYRVSLKYRPRGIFLRGINP